MSKLNFTECDVRDRSNSETVDSDDYSTYKPASFTLFDVPPNLNIKPKACSDISFDAPYAGQKNSVSPNSARCAIESDRNSSQSKKRRKRKNIDHQSKIHIITSSGHCIDKDQDLDCDEEAKGSSISRFLFRFLQANRNGQGIIPPPEIEPLKDTFIKEFSNGFDNVRNFSVLDENDENGSLSSDMKQITSNSFEPSSMKESIEQGKFAVENDSHKNYEATTESSERFGKFSMHIANLPYKMTAEDIEDFGYMHNYKFTSVVMGIDKRGENQSNGSATVVVDLTSKLKPHHVSSTTVSDNHHNATAVVNATKNSSVESTSSDSTGVEFEAAVGQCLKYFHGLDCRGRPLRATKWLSSGGYPGDKSDSRYFSLHNIGLKCLRCGLVGHTMRDCINPPLLQPCHLCAGSDHDAGNCLNIICYRCGKFGHHSRECRGPNMSRTVICTFCGSSCHDMRSCPVFPGSAAYVGDDMIAAAEADARVRGVAIIGQKSRMGDSNIRCLSCGQFGHVMCQSLPELEQAHIYCPNCGENGHHIDYAELAFTHDESRNVPNSRGINKKRTDSKRSNDFIYPYCIEPKLDAFMKYPQLLRDYDRLRNDKDSYYRSILRNSPYSDYALFPSLSVPASERRDRSDDANDHNVSSSSYETGYDNYGGDCARSSTHRRDKKRRSVGVSRVDDYGNQREFYNCTSQKRRRVSEPPDWGRHKHG